MAAIKDSPLADEVKTLRSEIDKTYKDATHVLRRSPFQQQECFEYLFAAERALADEVVSRDHLMHSRLGLANAKAILIRERAGNISVTAVVLVVYLVVGAIVAGALVGIFQADVSAEELNERLVMGIPQPVLIWAVVGSLASMLLRVGSRPFEDVSEAMRWVLTRPFVGTVMGVLVYLMVVAGLIVLAGDPKTQTPELIWVLAFAGGFSDHLSASLLGRWAGTIDTGPTRTANGAERGEPDRG